MNFENSLPYKESTGEEALFGKPSHRRRMEPDLDILKKNLIRKIESDVKQSFDSYVNNNDDFAFPAESKTGLRHRHRRGSADEQHNNDDVKLTKKSRRKEFKARESVLTVLLRQSKNIRTIYNIFAAILFHIILNTWANDWMNNRSLFQNMEIIWWNFGNVPIVLSIWATMLTCTLLVVFPLYSFWATSRRSILSDVRIIDISFLSLYITYQTCFLVIPAYLTRKVYDLPPASTMIVILEQLRLLMKVHSFVRENAARSMRYVHKPSSFSTNSTKDTSASSIEQSSPVSTASPSFGSTSEEPACPDFSCYLYFLFAPTLLYRDDYPRNDSIDWKFVRSNFIQAAVCVFYAAFIFSRFVFPGFSEFGTQPFHWETFLHSCFNMVLPGTLLLLIFHFLFLHSFLNAFAEMLRFADRLFYRDWWTSTSYGEYYRTWNVVVHDFLKEYIMYDTEAVLVWFTGKRSKDYQFLSMLITFLISAVFHEYVIIMAAGFFYPVLFFMFSGFGFWFMIIVQNNRFERFQNTIFWFLMTIGMGILITCYSQEWYAQLNCPHDGSSIFNYLVPRSLACYWK